MNLNLYNWKSWKPYLHIPLDMWVLRLLSKNYLNVCNDNFEKDFLYKKDYMSPSFNQLKYQHLQEDLKVVSGLCAEPPITLDSLWFVGNKYCAYHPLLCEGCWLSEECSRYIKFSLEQEPIITKQQKKEKQIKKQKELKTTVRQFFIAAQEQWLRENPNEEPPRDFNDYFINNAQGKAWLHTFSQHTLKVD
jgi:hypothetical protein